MLSDLIRAKRLHHTAMVLMEIQVIITSIFVLKKTSLTM